MSNNCGKQDFIDTTKNGDSDSMYNYVENPAHYAQYNHEPWDVIKDWGLDFDLGSCVKYIARAGKKPGNAKVQDLEKALQFLQHEILWAKKEIDGGYTE